MSVLNRIPLLAAILAMLAGSPASAQFFPSGDGEIFAGGLGSFQLTHTILGDIGWISSDGIWSKRAHRWKVGSVDDFLKNENAQEAAFVEYLRKMTGRMKKFGGLSHVGQEYVAPRLGRFTVTEGAVLAAAHLLGTFRANEILDKLRLYQRDKSVVFLPEEDRAIKRLRDFAEIPYARLQ